MRATSDEIGWLETLVILGVLVVLIGILVGVAFATLWLGEWFWNSIVCEDWVVCQ